MSRLTDLPLFQPPQAETTRVPWQRCNIGGRLYRARLGELYGRLILEAEYFHEELGWREVRSHFRKSEMVEALGMGQWDDETRRVQLHDGRWLGQPIEEGGIR